MLWHHISVLSNRLCVSERRTAELKTLLSTTEQVEGLLRVELTAAEEEVAKGKKREEMAEKRAEVAEEKVASATKEREEAEERMVVAEEKVAVAEEKVVSATKERRKAEERMAVAEEKLAASMRIVARAIRERSLATETAEKAASVVVEKGEQIKLLTERIGALEEKARGARKETTGMKRVVEDPGEMDGTKEAGENSEAVGRVGVPVPPGKVVVVEETKKKRKGKRK
ncbi:hypothetical protein C7212DRAFT_348138 [Tuber magnatum]|uniref:Uncharacterized protein n=1 Tax=Tuber magnatum TaxID=42249 RepID=A0A317SCJ4_9PEZI|nr:hypothetical protein C7212DRAFT_348138 [Tuber magnatum]